MATNNAVNKVITGTPTANAIPTWDGNVNLSANNMLQGFATIVSAAGTTALTVASSAYQLITGSTTQTITLPNATTLVQGTTYIINNQSTGSVTIQNNTPTTLVTLSTLRVIKYTLIDNSSAAGVWQLGDATIVTNQQNFTSAASGTYTPTPGTAYIQVEMVGGGGGSGGCSLLANAGSATVTTGGASGGYLKFTMSAAQIGASLAYTVGAGGAGGTSSTNGTVGNATTFGSWTAGAGQPSTFNNAAGSKSSVQSSANTVGTGNVIINIRPATGMSYAANLGTTLILYIDQGGYSPLSFFIPPQMFVAAQVGTTSGQQNGYGFQLGFGYGGYGVGVYGGTTAGAISIAGNTGRFGAILVTEYIYV